MLPLIFALTGVFSRFFTVASMVKSAWCRSLATVVWTKGSTSTTGPVSSR